LNSKPEENPNIKDQSQSEEDNVKHTKKEGKSNGRDPSTKTSKKVQPTSAAKDCDKKKVKLVQSPAMKQLLIHEQPRVLTLHLKRWSGLNKIGKFVQFPMELDLTGYCTERKDECKQYGYRLYGVVVHGGGMGGGHYTAFVRKRLTDGGDDVNIKSDEHPDPNVMTSSSSIVSKWFYFSDTHFHEASTHEVLSAEAYILFYERHEK